MSKQNKKILVADDDLLVRKMLSDILQSENYIVETAENGVEALKKIHNVPGINLILSDINMPEMDGMKLIEEIVKAGMDIPIVMLTSSKELSTAVEAINRGASDYLLKDHNMQNTVLHSVGKVLEKQQLIEDIARKNEELESFNAKLENIVQKMTEIATALSSEKDFSKLLDMIVTQALAVTNADGGTLFILQGDQLQVSILQNKKLNLYIGGTSGNPITLPSIPLTESNISAFCALKKGIINIPDVYESDKFDFSDTKKNDASSGYKTKSMLIIPLLGHENNIIGVLQLINASDSKTNEVVEFPQDQVEIVNSLACQAAISVENARSLQKIQEKNIAFQRFVPQEFLNCLGKKEVEEITLGDSSHEEMSVMFADIRSFTNLSESMSPKESFLFLNDYFKIIAPTIAKSKGFVDKFIGDAIMALFPGKVTGVADDALTAACEMQNKMVEYNASRKKDGYRPIAIGIGVHTGPLTLGTIGFESRVESTVVGDTVNIAARLESLTKRYEVLIAVASTSIDRLKKPDQFLVRELDTVQVKGKAKPLTIFEIFNSDPIHIKEMKIKLLSRHNEALSLYKNRKWDEAHKLFSELKKQIQTDKVFEIYIERCRSFKENKPNGSWTGVTVLNEKWT